METAKILKYLALKHGSVAEYARKAGISRQRVYQVMELTPELKRKNRTWNMIVEDLCEIFKEVKKEIR